MSARNRSSVALANDSHDDGTNRSLQWKIGASAVYSSLAPIINASIASSIYPNDCKKAYISPLYKKNDNLAKINYRPLSILTSLSKVTEGLLCEQLSSYMSDILSSQLSAYRKHYSCNNVLMKCVEDFRKSLDDGKYTECILIDLSSVRPQPKSENCSYPKWMGNNEKRRSTIEKVCNIYNYADDNTLSCIDNDPIVIQHTLEHAINVSLKWFDDNFMVANPTKFQAMFLGRHDIQLKINVHSSEIAVQSSVKLLGIQIDNKLTINDHVSTICKKSGNVINLMNR